MKNDQGQGHGAKFNREINLRQLVNAILSVRYVIPVLVTLFAAVATIYVLLLAAIYIGLPLSLLGAGLGVIIVLLHLERRIAAEIDGANNFYYQESPTKTSSNVAVRENLLTPEEVDALREIGSDSYQWRLGFSVLWSVWSKVDSIVLTYAWIDKNDELCESALPGNRILIGALVSEATGSYNFVTQAL